jgi:hypothetical protein
MSTYITIKDEEGIIRPAIGIWRNDDKLKYYQPEINKFMVKGIKQGYKLIEVGIKEIREFNFNK